MKKYPLLKEIGFRDKASKSIEDVAADKFEDFGVYIGQLYQKFQNKDISNNPAITQKIIDLDPNSFDQILLSAGQLSRVMMSRLYEFFKDKDIIDLGSCSDKLIYGTESFRHIMVRGHIDNNRPLIEERLRYFK